MASVLADFWTAAWHEGIGVSGGAFSWLQTTACEHNPHLLPPGIPAPWRQQSEGAARAPPDPAVLVESPPQLPREECDENAAFVLEKQLCCVSCSLWGVTHTFNLSSLSFHQQQAKWRMGLQEVHKIHLKHRNHEYEASLIFFIL